MRSSRCSEAGLNEPKEYLDGVAVGRPDTCNFQCNAIDFTIRGNHNVTVAHFTFAAAALFLYAQTTAELPSFEVAEVKVNKAVNANGSFKMLPSGQVAIRHASMKELIQGAWNLEDYAISGGPNWIDSEYHDVVAKAPPNSSTHDMELMLQRLLAERFRLAIHTEPKVMPVYAMVAAKGGLKMKEATAGIAEGGCRNTRTTGVLRRECGTRRSAVLRVCCRVGPAAISKSRSSTKQAPRAATTLHWRGLAAAF